MSSRFSANRFTKLTRRFVILTSLADRTANQRAQKATSDRTSASSVESLSSNPAARSDGRARNASRSDAGGSVRVLRQVRIAPAQRVGMPDATSRPDMSYLLRLSRYPFLFGGRT